MPTCVELAGTAYPKELPPMEGRSLCPALAGRQVQRDALFWEHEGNRAIRAGRWKAVAVDPAGPWELYDMERDRTEMHDLAVAEPQRLKELIAQWEQWARRACVIPWIWKPAYGSRNREEN